MANNRNGNYYGGGRQQQQAPAGNGWKVLSVIMALIILAAAVIGIFGSRKDGKWFAETDIAKFFNSWGKGDKLPDNGGSADVGDEWSGSFFVNADNEAKTGIRMRATGYSLREETYTLKAIKTPPDADECAYVWACSFVNATGWAADKNVNDYVTVEPIEEGGAEAVVTCLQPFSSRVKVTVSLSENPAVSGYATCDYACKPENITYSIPNQLTLGGGSSATWKWDASRDYETDIGRWDGYRGSVSMEWTEGTIDSNIEAFTMTVKCSEQLKEQLDKISMTDGFRADYRQTLIYSDQSRVPFSQGRLFYAGGNAPEGLFSFCGEAYDEDLDYLDTAYFKQLRTALQACSIDLIITISVQGTYGEEYIAAYNVNVDDATLLIYANGLAPDKPSIIF